MVAATLIDQPPAISGTLNKINHFVVLMLENRSFDHLLGALKAQNSAVAGALDNEYYNLTDPAVPTSPPVATGPAFQFATPFDPGIGTPRFPGLPGPTASSYTPQPPAG